MRSPARVAGYSSSNLQLRRQSAPFSPNLLQAEERVTYLGVPKPGIPASILRLKEWLDRLLGHMPHGDHFQCLEPTDPKHPERLGWEGPHPARGVAADALRPLPKGSRQACLQSQLPAALLFLSFFFFFFFFFFLFGNLGTDNLSRYNHEPSHGGDHVNLEWASTSSLKPFLTWDNKLTVVIQNVLYPEVGMEFSTSGNGRLGSHNLVATQSTADKVKNSWGPFLD